MANIYGVSGVWFVGLFGFIHMDAARQPPVRPQFLNIMKKTIITAMAAVALLSAGACSQSGNSKDNDGNRSETYTGILPAADVEGIRYTLRLDYGSPNDSVTGKYDLSEAYLVADSVANDSTGAAKYRDSVTYNTRGNFTVGSGTGEQAGISYIKLVPDATSENGETLYFLVSSDSTLTLTNAQLQAPESTALNYTLTREK